MSNEPEKKPEIIIDEDWKGRVQTEKEGQKRQEAQPGAADRPPAAPSDSAEDSSSAAKQDAAEDPSYAAHQADVEQLPPASFALLVTTLATQTMVALGQVPDQAGNPSPPRLDHAQHFIDTLSVLEEKTKGNLTAQEAAMLDSVLHQLRMLFVSAK